MRLTICIKKRIVIFQLVNFSIIVDEFLWLVIALFSETKNKSIILFFVYKITYYDISTLNSHFTSNSLIWRDNVEKND